MKIWLLSHTFYPARGGIENYLAAVSREIRRRGQEPYIICRRHLPGLPEREECEGVSIIRHPDFRVSRINLFRKPIVLTKKFARWLCSSGLAREGMAVCRYPYYQAALADVPGAAPSTYLPASVFPTLAGLAARGGTRKERFFFRLWEKQIREVERRAVANARRIVVFSRALRGQLADAYGIPAGRVEINPPGVDAQRFSPGGKDPDLAARCGLAGDVPVVLSLGRLSPEKNIAFLIEGLASLLKPDRCRLLLVGDGPSRLDLEALVREMGLKGKVIFAGDTRFPERYCRLADVFVSPSRYESFGQSILEALASGLPAIALRSDPPRIATAAEEIIADGESGYVIRDRPADLREKVELLIGNPGLRSAMGKRGREICLERFTWERHVSRLFSATP